MSFYCCWQRKTGGQNHATSDWRRINLVDNGDNCNYWGRNLVITSLLHTNQHHHHLTLTPHIRSVIGSAPAPPVKVKTKENKPSVVICRLFRIRMRTPEASLAVISMLVCCLETGEVWRWWGVVRSSQLRVRETTDSRHSSDLAPISFLPPSLPPSLSLYRNLIFENIENYSKIYSCFPRNLYLES